jgi:protein tyrosine phosphatase
MLQRPPLRLLEYGIDTIVNFTELGEKTTNGEELYLYEVDLRDVYQSRGRNLDAHRIAILDDHPPTITQAKKFCKLVDREIADGRRVYIHCRGGIGRTATMAASLPDLVGACRFGHLAEGDQLAP